MSYEEEKQDRKIEWLQDANTNFVHRICDQAREIERLRASLIDLHAEADQQAAHIQELDAEAQEYHDRAEELATKLAKSWQITEERKAAIWHAVAVLKENDPDDEHLWDEEIAVLRAMLTEAGQ